MVFGVCLVEKVIQNKGQIPYTLCLAVISVLIVMVSLYLLVESHTAQMRIDRCEVPYNYRFKHLAGVVMFLELFEEEVDDFHCNYQFLFGSQYNTLVHQFPKQCIYYIKVKFLDLELGLLVAPSLSRQFLLLSSPTFPLTLLSYLSFLGFSVKLILLVLFFFIAFISIIQILLFLFISYFSCSNTSFCSFLTQSVIFFLRYRSCYSYLTSFYISFYNYFCTFVLKSLPLSSYLFPYSVRSVQRLLYLGDSRLLFLAETSSYQISLRRLSLVQSSISFYISSSSTLTFSFSLLPFSSSFSCLKKSMVLILSLSWPSILSWQVVSYFLYSLIISSISLKSHCMTLYSSLKEVVCSVAFFSYISSSSCSMRLMSLSLVLVRVVMIFCIQFILKVRISSSEGL